MQAVAVAWQAPWQLLGLLLMAWGVLCSWARGGMGGTVGMVGREPEGAGEAEGAVGVGGAWAMGWMLWQEVGCSSVCVRHMEDAHSVLEADTRLYEMFMKLLAISDISMKPEVWPQALHLGLPTLAGGSEAGVEENLAGCMRTQFSAREHQDRPMGMHRAAAVPRDTAAMAFHHWGGLAGGCEGESGGLYAHAPDSGKQHEHAAPV